LRVLDFADRFAAFLDVIRKHHYFATLPKNIKHTTVVRSGAALNGYDRPGGNMYGYSLVAIGFMAIVSASTEIRSQAVFFA
jgi:hypothetical protein